MYYSRPTDLEPVGYFSIDSADALDAVGENSDCLRWLQAALDDMLVSVPYQAYKPGCNG